MFNQPYTGSNRSTATDIAMDKVKNALGNLDRVIRMEAATYNSRVVEKLNGEYQKNLEQLQGARREIEGLKDKLLEQGQQLLDLQGRHISNSLHYHIVASLETTQLENASLREVVGILTDELNFNKALLEAVSSAKYTEANKTVPVVTDQEYHVKKELPECIKEIATGITLGDTGSRIQYVLLGVVSQGRILVFVKATIAGVSRITHKVSLPLDCTFDELAGACHVVASLASSEVFA